MILLFAMLKQNKYLTFILLMLSGVVVYAQSFDEREQEKNIIERITTESNGSVTIEMPENVIELMNPYRKQDRQISHAGTYKTLGYRIQVFSDGRNQQTLESRANARGNIILSRFSKYRGQVYSFSKSPNWYTRVGNFETLTEANSALEELKQAFPEFASEMRVVKCEVIIRKK